MKAIVCERYGPPDVLRLEEVAAPVPGEGEVLVKVHAASANPLDWRLLRGEPYLIRLTTGLAKPGMTRPGVDLAGRVEAVGAGVSRLRVGDEVFGVSPRGGAFAEYVCAFEKDLATKPASVSFEEAAAVPVAAFTALQGLRDAGRIQNGQRVLVNGAAGGVGSFAVQVARTLGAAHVTGVCSTRNVERVRSIGADHVIDYTREDFAAGTMKYDLAFDAIGTRPLSAFRRVLEPQGTYVVVGGPGGKWVGPLGALAKPLFVAPFVSQRMVGLMSRESAADLALLREWLAAGKVRSSIDRSYPLADVPAALRYLEDGHAQGKVVIRIG